jgi:predicted homoserine dehydrogenase-like protein
MAADDTALGGRRIGAATGLAADLQKRLDQTGRPIRVGLIGSGEMGTDIVTQCRQMTGITVAAIAEINVEAAKKALTIAGRGEAYNVTDSSASFSAALEAGRVAITQDAQAVCSSEHIDVVIDATGKPAVGAEIGLTAMEHGKHLVMMNVEADVTIGAYLAREAKRLGVVYTLGAGDEPSSTMELVVDDGARQFRDGPRLSHRRRRQGQEQPAQHRRDAG